MTFIEVETWRIDEGKEEAHHEMIRSWFRFVKEHHAEMFQEWKSTRYYRQTTKHGKPTGCYIMLFEFYTREGYRAYKERRKDWAGPYADYKKVDPYELFNKASTTEDYWEPQEVNLWFTFD